MRRYQAELEELRAQDQAQQKEVERLYRQNGIYENENLKLNDQINGMLNKDTDTSVHLLNLNRTINRITVDLK